MALMGAVADAALEVGGHGNRASCRRAFGGEGNRRTRSVRNCTKVSSMIERQGVDAGLCQTGSIALPRRVRHAWKNLEIWTWAQLGRFIDKPLAFMNVLRAFYDRLLLRFWIHTIRKKVFPRWRFSAMLADEF